MEASRRTRRHAGIAICVAAALLASLWLASSVVPIGSSSPPVAGDRARDELPAVATAPAPPVAPADAAVTAELSEKSTLAAWKVATSNDRSRVAVALARKNLSEDATRLEIARVAMEITGCVTATARDPRFAEWTVEPTAATCLSAPEKPVP